MATPTNPRFPAYKFNVPFWMFDIQNKQLITSVTIPNSDITDSKDVILTEQPIPGSNFSPVYAGGMGNRKISFTLPIVKRNNTVGNLPLLRQYQNLRERSFGYKGMFRQQAQFTPNPKVLFNWGLGSIPLIYFVKKCDFTHRQGLTNQLGFSQYTDVHFELWLDEANPYNKTEALFRKIGSIAGQVQGAADVIAGMKGYRPY